MCLKFINFQISFKLFVSLFIYFLPPDPPRNICPLSPTLAEAVPGNEEDYPCISYWSVIRIQSKGLIRGVGMVEALFENKPIRSFCIVYGGWNLLQTVHASLHANWPQHSFLHCIGKRLSRFLLLRMITLGTCTYKYIRLRFPKTMLVARAS